MKRRKQGRPVGGRRLDPIAVGASIAEMRGNVTAVARRYDVTRTAIQNLIRGNESLQAIVRDAREGMIDDAESALYRAVLNGEAWAVCFLLKTQAKARGYIEKHQIEATETKTLVVVEEIIDANDPKDDPPAPGAS